MNAVDVEPVETPPAEFSEAARVLAGRAAAAYYNPGEAVIDHYARRLRGERRGCGATSDELVGLAEGLRDIVVSWGIPPRCVSPGEYVAKSFFHPDRRWDFAVVGVDGQPVVLIEIKNGGARHGHGRLRRDVEVAAAMALDSLLAYPLGTRLFRGAAFVIPTFRRTGALRNARLRRDRLAASTRRFQHSVSQLVRCRLFDSVLALYMDERSFHPVADSLRPERFLQRLHAFLGELPKETWG